MKPLKLVSVFILSLFLTLSLSCEHYQFEGDPPADGGGGASSCVEASNNASDAATAFSAVTPADDNYTIVCITYANALQDLIDLCGDPTSSIQTVLDSLDCSSTAPDNCPDAQTASATAETAYNADTTNTTLCNAYINALENEITQCGDTSGELQDIIDGLDCTSDVVLPMQITQTYPDGSTIVESFTFSGNKLTRSEYTTNFVGDPSETYIFDYIYEDNLLVRIDESYVGSGFDDSGVSVFEYNTDGLIIRETFTPTGSTDAQVEDYVHNLDGTVTFNEDGGEIYIYTFSSGNLTIEDNTTGPHDYTYSYDTSNGVFKNIHAREVFVLLGNSNVGNNNLITAVNTGGVTFPDNENISYTYNSDNYPITANTIENEGTADESTYTSEILYY